MSLAEEMSALTDKGEYERVLYHIKEEAEKGYRYIDISEVGVRSMTKNLKSSLEKEGFSVEDNVISWPPSL